MAEYVLLASESTVQVLSATVVNDVIYSTIQTSPSGVIASMPLDKAFFEAGVGNQYLQYFADGIEAIMSIDGVIAGAGSQQLDSSGLLADTVTFTVTYSSSGSASGAVTADADVPVGYLNATPGTTSGGGIPAAEEIVNAAISNLQALAGG